MAMPTKRQLADYFLTHPYQYFEVGKCTVCGIGDASYFANRSGLFKHGSTCTCAGQNADASWDALGYYLDPANGWETQVNAFMAGEGS